MNHHEAQQTRFYEVIAEANQEFMIVCAILESLADAGPPRCRDIAAYLTAIVQRALVMSGRRPEWLWDQHREAQARLDAMFDRLRFREVVS